MDFLRTYAMTAISAPVMFLQEMGQAAGVTSPTFSLMASYKRGTLQISAVVKLLVQLMLVANLIPSDKPAFKLPVNLWLIYVMACCIEAVITEPDCNRTTNIITFGAILGSFLVSGWKQVLAGYLLSLFVYVAHYQATSNEHNFRNILFYPPIFAMAYLNALS